MDLGAYIQIEDLDAVAEANRISVPRLRGYRMMRDETPYTEEQIEKECNALHRTYMRLFDDTLYLKGRHTHSYDKRQIRGQARRAVRRQRKQMEMWNQYAGKEGILYIHARVGGWNWKGYGCSPLEHQPWFLGRADDGFDQTYCDIYAKVKE